MVSQHCCVLCSWAILHFCVSELLQIPSHQLRNDHIYDQSRGLPDFLPLQRRLTSPSEGVVVVTSLRGRSWRPMEHRRHHGHVLTLPVLLAVQLKIFGIDLQPYANSHKHLCVLGARLSNRSAYSLANNPSRAGCNYPIWYLNLYEHRGRGEPHRYEVSSFTVSKSGNIFMIWNCCLVTTGQIMLA